MSNPFNPDKMFGFKIEVEKIKNQHKVEIKDINIHKIINLINNKKINNLECKRVSANEIVYGEEDEAIRALIGSGLNVYFNRKRKDLLGLPIWITKKIYQIDRINYIKEEYLAEEILDVIEQLIKTPLESPKDKYENLYELVKEISKKCTTNWKGIFYPKGIKQTGENEYIVRLGVTGQGVGAPDSRRVIENQTAISFVPKHGYIMINNYNIESPIGKMSFSIMPKDTKLTFFPTQSVKEIAEAVSNIIYWY